MSQNDNIAEIIGTLTRAGLALDPREPVCSVKFANRHVLDLSMRLQADMERRMLRAEIVAPVPPKGRDAGSASSVEARVWSDGVKALAFGLRSASERAFGLVPAIRTGDPIPNPGRSGDAERLLCEAEAIVDWYNEGNLSALLRLVEIGAALGWKSTSAERPPLAVALVALHALSMADGLDGAASSRALAAIEAACENRHASHKRVLLRALIVARAMAASDVAASGRERDAMGEVKRDDSLAEDVRILGRAGFQSGSGPFWTLEVPGKKHHGRVRLDAHTPSRRIRVTVTREVPTPGRDAGDADSPEAKAWARAWDELGHDLRRASQVVFGLVPAVSHGGDVPQPMHAGEARRLVEEARAILDVDRKPGASRLFEIGEDLNSWRPLDWRAEDPIADALSALHLLSRWTDPHGSKKAQTLAAIKKACECAPSHERPLMRLYRIACAIEADNQRLHDEKMADRKACMERYGRKS